MEHPPYTKVTPEYWSKRSDSPAYQSAYKMIAKRVPMDYKGVVFDLACGPGRLLAKLRFRMPKGVLIGTDSNDAMLYLAREHLTILGLKVENEDDCRRIDFERPGVYLLKDNLVSSNLPDSVSSRTFFTFPELGTYPDDQLDGNLARKVMDKFERYIDAGQLARLQAEMNAARITKKDGKFITAVYGCGEMNANSEYNLEKSCGFQNRFEFIGLKLTDIIFREDPRVYADTINYKRRDILPKNFVPGYWVLEMKKD